MKIAIASGKGGTGKTTIAANLASVFTDGGQTVQCLDCDVEEPNAHIFLNPQLTESNTVSLPVPKVDESQCTGCGLCGQICQYHAIAMINNKPLIFPEMCHACGGCMLVCPEKAITEIARPIGVIERGFAGLVEFVHGRLNVGEVLAPPLIRAVRKFAKPDKTTIVDCPPGTSCPVIAAIRGCDFVILVTEPTPFGLHDLVLAVDMTRALKIPFGVIVNRMGIGDDRVHKFCGEQNISILLEIPDDRRIAEAYSRGELIIDALSEYRALFDGLRERLMNIKMED